MSVEDNISVKGFLPLSEIYIGEIDPEHSFDFPDDPSLNQDHSGKSKQSKDFIYESAVCFETCKNRRSFAHRGFF